MNSNHLKKKESCSPSGEVRWSLFARSIVKSFYNALRSLDLDRCYWHAAALTYYTLLSILPVFAVAFGVAKGFGLEERLETGVKSTFVEQPDFADTVLQITYNYVDQAKGGVIAGVGVLFLFLTTLLLLKRIEDVFNEIWRVKKGRSTGRMVADYLAIVIFAPLLLVISASISLYLATSLQDAIRIPYVSELIDHLFLAVIRYFPLLTSWIFFALLYYLIPNRRVNVFHALFAGIVAGTLYQSFQWLYIFFQVHISNYGAVYGSFAALPLFFIWLNVSWTVTLFGAEFAYHLSVAREKKKGITKTGVEKVNVSEKEIALFITYKCVQQFHDRQPPLTQNEMADELGLSHNTISRFFERLVEKGLLIETEDGSGEEGYVPAFAINKIKIQEVIDAIDENKETLFLVHKTRELSLITRKIELLHKTVENSRQNIAISEIINKLSPS